MTTYFISDTHFGHTKVIEYEDRPFANADEMDRLLIQNWNQKVKEDDLVYHLGDVGLHKKSCLRDIIHKLNGTKILVRGNHDFRPTAMMNLGFDACLESAFLHIGRHDCYLSHEPFPMSAPNTWMIHGHVHSKWKVLPFEKKICMSVENWNYAPVDIKELISIMDKSVNPWNTDGQREEEEAEEREENSQGVSGRDTLQGKSGHEKLNTKEEKAKAHEARQARDPRQQGIPEVACYWND